MSEKASATAGNSLLERLPNELLFRILDLLITQNPRASLGQHSWFMLENLPIKPNSIQKTHFLFPCLLVSRRMHNVALPLFYRDVQLVQEQLAAKGSSHNKFLDVMDENPDLALLVRSFDMTEYLNQSGSSILWKSLSLFPRLRSLHVQLDEFKSLKSEDLHEIFLQMSELKTLVIENACGKTEPSFLAEFLRTLETADQTLTSNIRSLAFQSKSGLSPSLSTHSVSFFDAEIFSKYLPRFPKLQALDLGFTTIDPNALLAIDSNTRLQYLRISHCKENDTSTLARFLSAHPAVKHSLVAFNGTGVRFTENDTAIILSNLPPTLRSLNLTSSIMTKNHIPDLQRLCRHLEELSVGTGLTMMDVEVAILGRNFSFDADDRSRDINEGISSPAVGHDLVLRPMRDAIAVCNLRRRLASISRLPTGPNMRRSSVRYLDVKSMDQVEKGRVSNSVLLGPDSIPLECIVVSGIMVEDHRALKKICGACGWTDKWAGEMAWVERK